MVGFWIVPVLLSLDGYSLDGTTSSWLESTGKHRNRASRHFGIIGTPAEQRFLLVDNDQNPNIRNRRNNFDVTLVRYSGVASCRMNYEQKNEADMIGTSYGSKGMNEMSLLGRHRSSSSSDVASSPPEPQHDDPPPPQQPQQKFMIPPWTPWTPNPQHSEEVPPASSYLRSCGTNNSKEAFNGMIDDESLPSIPDVPSPYSPPPASLFSSEEEFPSKSVRKYKQAHDEYRIQNHALHYQENQHHNSAYNNSIPSDEKHHMNQSQYNRQQLLPTVLYLKKDLEESHASMHLLQQENKALVSECDKFQNEIHIWKEQQTQIVSLKDQQIAQLQEQLRSCQLQSNETKHVLEKERSAIATTKEEVERLTRQLEASTATSQRLDVNNVDLKQELELKRSEIKSLRSTMKDQSQGSAQKMKDAVTSFEAKIQKLKEENQSLTIETDRLKAMHNEAVQRCTKEVASAAETYRAELAMVRAELTDARQTIIDLEKGKTNVNGELMKRDDIMKELQEQVQTLRTSDAIQKEEINRMKASVADATEREDKLLSEIERKEKHGTVEQAKLNDEIERLTSALQQVVTDKEALETSLTQALETSYAKYKALRVDKENIEKELLTVKTQKQKHSPSSVVVVERNNELEAEMASLKSSLSKMTSKCNELRAERSNLTKKLSQYKKDEGVTPRDGRTQPPKVFTFNETNNESDKNEDELIPNRLERIRDAAERAALSQEHRRELSRLKMEHEKEMKVVSERHEQDIKDVFEEAKAEVTARSRELRRHLQSEYETKIVTLERRYQSDLARVCLSFNVVYSNFHRFESNSFFISFIVRVDAT